jgi:hypothetical protein
MQNSLIHTLTYDIPIEKGKTIHLLCAGDFRQVRRVALQAAELYHFTDYVTDPTKRTRISLVVEQRCDVEDFVFEYRELLDNSYWRTVDLETDTPVVIAHHPQYADHRADFVDIEWEFIIGRLSHPVLQQKLSRWVRDERQNLVLAICFAEKSRNEMYTQKLQTRLGSGATILSSERLMDESAAEDLTELGKYLHYFYVKSHDLQHVPTELPEEEVNAAWLGIEEESFRKSNINNISTIPLKMRLLGHDRSDWNTLYALTAQEIEQLTAVEHNRWCVERLIEGWRPCTDTELQNIQEDMQQRVTDASYAKEHPVSLKTKYKREQRAHSDLVPFASLGVDESGLSVVRYDRDLTAAIPLIVKVYNDRHHG